MTPSGFCRRRWHWLCAGLTVLILAAVVVHGWHTPGDDTLALVKAPAVLSPHATTIVPGVHLLGGLSPAAAYVVETSAGLVLIDSGLEPDASGVKSEMGRLGLDWKWLRAVLLTHVHADHSGGAQHLRDATGAKVYAGQGDAAILRAGAPREAFYSKYMWHATGHPTTVDVELKNDDTIALGDVRFRVLSAAGHTPGSICYLMERNGLRLLFSGDVIMSPPGPYSTSPLGTYAAYLSPRYRGDARAFRDTLRRLRALPAPDLIFPGHPRYDVIPQSPALSPERWQAMLDDGIRELEALLARYQRDGAHFLESTPSKLLPDLYYLGEFQGTAVYGLVASAKLFVIADVAGPGLLDLAQAACRKLGVVPTAPTALLLTAYRPPHAGGLKDMLAKASVTIVAESAALSGLRKACPAATVILSAQDLSQRRWFDVTPIPLFGKTAPVAYRLRWGEKVILFSGRVPVPAYNQTAREQTAASIKSDADVLDFLSSLRRLGEFKPDLWLPALPLSGQNASMHGNEWQDLIAENERRILEFPGNLGGK
jgi:glyoxylase-like metal-dependent hydrolase (beta-lactamase superfamily II)